MSIGMLLLIAFVLLLGNAFFVGAEFGLVSVRRSSIEHLAIGGSKRAKVTLSAMEKLSLMLATSQLGVTICSLGIGAVGEPAIAHLLREPLLATGLSEHMLHPISFALALVVMTYVHVVIGEMVPKNIALAGPDKTALVLTPPLVLMTKALKPIIVALNGLSNVCVRLVGVKPKGEIASTFEPDEVAGFAEESRREGLISENEKNLMVGTLQFDECKVKKVVLPNDQVTSLKMDSAVVKIEHLVAQTGYSRFPVVNHGKFVGYIHIKDVLSAARPGHILSPENLRPLTTLHAGQSLREALTIMQKSGSHMAKVTDHSGKTLGVATLEDILGEMVGDITEHSQSEKALQI